MSSCSFWVQTSEAKRPARKTLVAFANLQRDKPYHNYWKSASNTGKRNCIVPKHGLTNNKLMADSCFTSTIQCLKKRNEKQVFIYIQVIDPFLRQYNNYRLLITLFFMTWDKSSPAYTHQPQLWANEAPMTCVSRWNRTVGSSHWSHVGQMLLQ